MGADELLDRFEAAWRRGQPPELSQLLGSAAAQSMDRVARRNLLAELVMVDVWHRWRQASRGPVVAVPLHSAEEETQNSQPPTGSLAARPCLEDYLRQYPELGPLEELPPVVIGEEYRARQQWGDRPAHEDYLSRFPYQAPQLEQLLPEIDRELAGDTLETHVTPTPQGRPTAAEPGDGASGSPAAPPTTIGKYHVIGVLEEGGQAQVYRAVHPTLAKELVIKLGRTPLGSGAMERDQLVAEGRLLSELDHPNSARVYDLDFHENRPFVVMEYVRGRNLRHYARQHRYGPREAALLVAKIARALSVAHARGIIHQDVKPGNIIIDESGEPRVIDFGLARLRPAWSEAPEEPGGISGTVQYMSPEQARAETDKIDARSDVFALGAVLYFLLVGRAPFADESVLASLDRARECDFDASALRRAGVPRRLEAACLRAMQAEPADRYASAEQMAADLERFLGGPRRRKITLAVAAALILAALAPFAASMMRDDGQETSPAISPAGGPDERVEPVDPGIALLGRPLRHDFLLDFTILGHEVGEDSRVVLTAGEKPTFRIEADRDCCVGIWLVVDGKEASQLFPNEDEPDHLLVAGEPRTVSGFAVTPSEGLEYLHVVACTDLEELVRWRTRDRGIVFAKDDSPHVSEQLLILDVRPAER